MSIEVQEIELEERTVWFVIEKNPKNKIVKALTVEQENYPTKESVINGLEDSNSDVYKEWEELTKEVVS